MKIIPFAGDFIKTYQKDCNCIECTDLDDEEIIEIYYDETSYLELS